MRRPGWFKRKTLTARESEATTAIKAWVMSHLALPDDTVMAINEIVCNDPSCPGTETVILIMAPGQTTKALKIGRELAEVTQGDVVSALRDDGG